MMQETYRQLQEEDAAEYYDVLHRSYQTEKWDVKKISLHPILVLIFGQ